MLFSWSPSVHFKHLVIVCGSHGVTKRCHRYNGIFSECISFYPLLFPCDCHGAAWCWAPNLSLCSGHVECCSGLFSSGVSLAPCIHFSLFWKEVRAVEDCSIAKCLPSISTATYLTRTCTRWLENSGSIPRSIIFCQSYIDRRLWTPRKFWTPSQLVPC